MQNSFTEIERKFLINSFPDSLPLKEEFQVYQAYLSIDPEVRIRRNVVNGQDKAYYLAIKSGGKLVRKEIELHITKEQFYALAEIVEHPFVLKDFRIYQLTDELDLECSLVDKGSNTEFMYAEIEFPSVDAAQSFQPLPIFIQDVTDNPAYKMKNYWRRTRLAEALSLIHISEPTRPY